MWRFWSILIVLVLTACGQLQIPVVVVITPTPDGESLVLSESEKDEDTVIDSEEEDTVISVAMSSAEDPVATLPPEDAVDSPPASITKELLITTPVPTRRATVVGPIIGENYILPPTNTPFASPTPLPSETPVPPTPTVTPTMGPVTPFPALDASQIGVQVHTNFALEDWQVVLELARQMRVGWLKMQANWAFLQPDHAGQFDQTFRLFQIQVQDAKKKGFKVLISAVKAPDWARNVNRNEDGPPDDPNFYANFIRILLEKVGEDIDAIEIWNEPNLLREWQGSLPFNGAGYMQLFDLAYQAVREYSPTLTIITAGLAPTGDSPGSIDDRNYLQQMYDAGLGAYRDIVVGFHPYSWGNPPDARCCNAIEGRGWDDDPHFFFSHNVEDYRAIMEQRGHADLQLWATEFGWATWDGIPGEAPQLWMTYNTPQQQSDYTLRAFELGQEMDFMGPMFLWNMNFANDITIRDQNEIVGYSLLLPPLDSGRSIQTRPLYWGVAEALGHRR